MPEDPKILKNNLNTQKGITDELKEQKKHLADQTFGSKKYLVIQEKIAKLEKRKSDFAKEQKKTQDELFSGAKSIAQQITNVKIEYEKVMSAAIGSEDYTRRFSKRINESNIPFKVGMNLAKASARLIEDNIKVKAEEIKLINESVIGEKHKTKAIHLGAQQKEKEII